MNVHELFQHQVRDRPGQAAIITGHGRRLRVTTFAQLAERSARAAGRLAAGGLRAGDAALVLHGMSADLYAVLIALFRMHVTATAVDPAAGIRHVDRCCRLAGLRGFVGGAPAHLLRLVCGGVRAIPKKFVIRGWVPGARTLFGPPRDAECETLADTPRDSGASPADGAEPALLTFTSGSTGQPKAVVRTHRLLAAQQAALQRALHLSPGDVDLTTLPIFVLCNLAAGVTSVIADADLRRPGAIDPAPVLRQIRRCRPNSTVASPAFLERLIDACEAAGETLPELRRVFTGGAPVFPALLERLARCFERAEVVAVYGSTEAEPIAHVAWSEVSPADHEAMRRGRGLLAGRPVPEVQMRILKDRWGAPLGPFDAEALERETQATGEPGEIVVCGEHVVPGYLHGMGDAETKLDAAGRRWHRTGDAGYLDARGRLWLLGRCAARIDDEHGRLYPFAVECAAMAHPWVRRAALVAGRDGRVLAVEPRAAPPVSTAVAALRDELAWARLGRVAFLRAIPVDRRHNAKIDYPRLRALLTRR